MAAFTRVECGDFLQFQDVLKKMRGLDDSIIYALNVQLPTESFKSENVCKESCKELFEKLQQNFQEREVAINRCLEYSSSRVSEMKKKQEREPNNIGAIKELRKEQSKIRLLQTEQGVEEIIKQRTNKVFYERCREYFLPESLRM